jgi:hypothetical protein
MTHPTELRERHALIAALQQTNDPAAAAKAAQLRRSFHDDEMAGLANDVYDAAMHKGQAPAGWTRATELLREGRTEELYQRMPAFTQSAIVTCA